MREKYKNSTLCAMFMNVLCGHVHKVQVESGKNFSKFIQKNGVDPMVKVESHEFSVSPQLSWLKTSHTLLELSYCL